MSNGDKPPPKKNWHGGKGSQQRKTDRQKFSDNWDAIFGAPKKDKSQEEKEND